MPSAFSSSLKSLDALLRGQSTTRQALAAGELQLPLKQLTLLILALGFTYGLCMGTFAAITGRGGGWPQMLSAGPALFLLTLAVTFPSLYTFNALVGSRLSLLSLLRLLIASISVILALLASFGTIVAFFSFTTESYAFMTLLNVALFAASALLGLGFLLQTLHRLTLSQENFSQENTANAPFLIPPPLPSEGALEPTPNLPPSDRTKTVFKIWLLLFALVGAQMSWILRPFIGSGTTFALFRPKSSNFFEAVYHSLQHLLS